jgi:hypothetical protein
MGRCGFESRRAKARSSMGERLCRARHLVRGVFHGEAVGTERCLALNAKRVQLPPSPPPVVSDLSPRPDWTRAPLSEGGGCRFESGRGYHATWRRSSVAEHLNAITNLCSLLTSRRLMVTALNGVVVRFESSPSPQHDVTRTGVLRRRRAGSDPASRRFKSVPRFRQRFISGWRSGNADGC